MANEGDADLPRHTIDDIVERGRATRFAPGNQVAKGHGRGRPKKSAAAARARASDRTIKELLRIAFDRTHPMHDRYAYNALRDVMKATTPRSREITGRDGEKLTLFDAHELVYGKPKDGDPDDPD